MTGQKILIIKLSAIGDVLMATPAFKAIKESNPDSKIHLLVGEWSRGIVEKNPNIDELIVIDENIFWKKRIFELYRLLRRIRAIGFDKVYVMHWANSFNLFALLAGAKERIGFNRHNKSMFLTRKVQFEEGSKDIHMVERYLNLATDNYQHYDKTMDIYLTAKETSEGRDFLENIGPELADNCVGIAPGGGVNPKSSMPSRCWPKNNFVELARKLLNETKFNILLLGGKAEVGLCGEISTELINDRVVNVSGKTSLRQSAAVIKNLKAIICNDSAPMHLASSVDTPVISIFGPTAPYDKAPLNQNSRYIYKGFDCSPCYDYGRFADCGHTKCLASITPEDVFNNLLKAVK